MAVIFQMAISTTLLFALLLMVGKIFALLATKSFMLLIPLKLITGTMVHKQSVATSVLVVTHLFGWFLILQLLKNSTFTWLMSLQRQHGQASVLQPPQLNQLSTLAALIPHTCKLQQQLQLHLQPKTQTPSHWQALALARHTLIAQHPINLFWILTLKPSVWTQINVTWQWTLEVLVSQQTNSSSLTTCLLLFQEVKLHALTSHLATAS